jgi:hypothetical protein
VNKESQDNRSAYNISYRYSKIASRGKNDSD